MAPRCRRIRRSQPNAVADDRLHYELLLVMLGDRQWRCSVRIVVERSQVVDMSCDALAAD